MKGNIILSESLSGGFVSKAIKLFTGKIAKKNNVPVYTHAMYEVGELLGKRMVISAEPTGMNILPLDMFRNEETRFRIYRLKDNITEKELDKILVDNIMESAGKPYGYLQLLWFIYRWAMESLGFDVRKQKNWFPDNEVCSEDTYEHIGKRVYNRVKPLAVYLNRWNENTFHPVDLAVVIKTFPEYFELVEEYNM